MGLWSYVAGAVRQVLSPENKKELDWLLSEAQKRRPLGYMSEIPRRVDYLNADMEDDMTKMLKEEFPKSYEDLKRKRVEFPFVQLVTQKRARVFEGLNARHYLVNPGGEEVDPENLYAVSHDAMIERSSLNTALVQLDGLEDMTNGVAAYTWFDTDHLEISPYTGDKCHMAISPARFWDPYSSRGVAFEQEGFEGVYDEPRYVIFGVRDHEVADETDIDGRGIWHPSLHYVANSKESLPVNNGDKNPYKNRFTGQPLYPFTWFTSRKGDIYWKGGDNLVEFNRVLNLMLTYLIHNAIWQMAIIPCFEFPLGSASKDTLSKLKKVIFSAPNKAFQVPPGVTFSFKNPQGDLAPFQSLVEMLTQYEAMFNQLSPKSIDIKGGMPQSGIALQIEMSNLVNYIKKRQKLFAPHVDHLKNDVMISIWNVRAPFIKNGKTFRAIPEGYRSVWDPGTIDTGPVDFSEIIDRHIKGMPLGAYSPEDLVMALHGITKKEAIKRVDENIARYQEILKAGTRYPAESMSVDKALEGLPIEDEEEEEPTPEQLKAEKKLKASLEE